MFDLLDRLVKEWPVIEAAPLSFTLAVLVATAIVAGCIYLAFRYRYKVQFELKDARIATYEHKLQGASPEEARAHLDELRREVSKLYAELKAIQPPPPRHLSRESVALLRAGMDSFSGSTIEVVAAEDEECYHYASELISALKDCGVVAQLEHLAFGGPDPRDRDRIFFARANTDQTMAETFRDAISKATGSPCGLRWLRHSSGPGSLGRIIVNRPSA